MKDSVSISLNWEGDNQITLTTQIVIFEQEGSMIVYSPTLELYGYGINLEEAKDSWRLNTSEFFKFGLENSTLTEELKRLGWTKKDKSSELSNQLWPPSFAG